MKQHTIVFLIKPYLKSDSVNNEALILAVTKAAAAERDFVLIKKKTTVSHWGLGQTCDWSELDTSDSFHSCNI